MYEGVHDMNVYERALFSIDNSNRIYDYFGNCDIMEKNVELTAVFSSTSSFDVIPHFLNYNDYSILIDNKKEKTFSMISEALLSNMQKIEMLFYQFWGKRSLTERDIQMLDKYLYLEELRIDGHVSSDEYNQKMNDFAIEIIEPIIKMMNIQVMHNSILDELFHAQYRMIDGFNSQLTDMKLNKEEIGKGRELRSYSIYADNAAFCYQDALKAIYKVLDIFSKWFSYISNYKNCRRKVEPKYFKDIKKEIMKLDNDSFRQRIEVLYKSLEILTMIRNEITHNKSLERNRHVLFNGRGTHEVNNKDLFYSKMLFWNYDEHALEQASGSLGFYTQNRDILTETQNYFVNTIKLVILCQEHFFNKIIEKLAVMGIEKPYVWYGCPESIQRFTLEEIKEFYYYEDSLL